MADTESKNQTLSQVSDSTCCHWWQWVIPFHFIPFRVSVVSTSLNLCLMFSVPFCRLDNVVSVDRKMHRKIR